MRTEFHLLTNCWWFINNKNNDDDDNDNYHVLNTFYVLDTVLFDTFISFFSTALTHCEGGAKSIFHLEIKK